MNGLYQFPALFLTAFCHVIIVYYMSESKYSIKKFALYGCMFMACFVGMGSYGYAVWGVTAIFIYMLIAGCLFLFSCMVSQDSFSRKCFLFITYFCLFSVLDNILKIAIKVFLPQLSAPAGYYAAVILRSTDLLLILVLYKKYAVEVFRSLAGSGRRRWWNLALIALLFYLLQASLSIVNVKNFMPNEQLLPVLAALSFLMCAVYGVVFSNISYMKKEEEAALVRQNAEHLFARLSALQEAEEAHRRLRHDMRHHLETIAEYAKNGDISAVLAYIGEYGKEVSETAIKRYSVNRTVDSILSVYAGKAEKRNIAFAVECNVPADLTVRDIDLTALLGNLLENALYGCLESGKENLCIKINIQVRNNRLVTVCGNTCSDGLKLSGSLPAGKSIGISSILAVCQKYNGDLDYKIENGICCARTILHL